MVELTSAPPAVDTGNRGGSQSALVIGGGLAGIAASARLAQSGWNVTLLESRATLGGRVFAFNDPVSGRTLDNGQHVIVGACRTFTSFLELIGARDHWHLQPRLDVAVYSKEGRPGRLYGGNSRAPFYLMPAFFTYPHLSTWDKVGAVRGLIAMMRVRRDRPELDGETFYDWLRRHGQSEQVISHLWNVLIEGTLNDNVRDVSAYMGLMIVQDGMLEGGNAIRIGYPTAPLNVALTEPAHRFLEGLGVRIATGCPARNVNVGRNGEVCDVSLANGSSLRADAYVSAVPFWTLDQIMPAEVSETHRFGELRGLRTSPIINVYLRYDRPVMFEDFCYFVDSPLQWVFNSSRIFGCSQRSGEQSLTVSISAAWDYIDCDRSELADSISAEVTRLFPASRKASLLDAVVVKQRNATIRCVPGANRYRPGPGTSFPNLFLAGEWTDTGWPSTMEGAVLSGYNAAEAVMSSVHAGALRENRVA